MFFLILVLVSCKDGKNDNTTVSAPLYEPVDVINYVFVTIKTEEPTLVYNEATTIASNFIIGTAGELTETDYKTTPEFTAVKWIENMHLSKIIEVKNLTEDDKYRLMDTFESSIAYELDLPYQMEVRRKVTDPSTRDFLLKSKTTKKERGVSVFTSYKDASQNREILSAIWIRSVEYELTGKSMNIEYNNLDALR